MRRRVVIIASGASGPAGPGLLPQSCYTGYVRLAFLTSTPLDVRRGSGTFVGTHTLLAAALGELGTSVEIFGNRVHLPVYTLERFFITKHCAGGSGRSSMRTSD